MPIRSFRGSSALVSLLACVAPSFATAQTLAKATPTAPQAAPIQDVYTVKPGDMLSIAVWKEPDLTAPVLVRPDGTFSFPLAGQMDARGKTVQELQQMVT